MNAPAPQEAGVTGARTTRFALAATGILVSLALLPAIASAHNAYPHADSPPAWWWETLGSQVGGPDANTVGCVGVEQPFDGFSYDLRWESCYQEWGAGSTTCSGNAAHSHSPADALYSGNFVCEAQPVFYDPEGKYLCWRNYEWEERSGLPRRTSDTGWVPRDCRPELDGWPDHPGSLVESRKCRRAKAKLKKAKRKLKDAATGSAKKKAKKRLKKAKRKKRKAC